MDNCSISAETLAFLRDLKVNNNRPWFEDNRARYHSCRAEFKRFVADIEAALNAQDSIEKVKIFRINRDIRFSKDKTPYKHHFSVGFHRQKPDLRGGYYFRVCPGESMIACGFWNPEREDLTLIRKHIAWDHDKFRAVVSAPAIQAEFGKMEGAQLKTAPKGFSRDHEAIDLLRYKQYLFTQKIDDNQVLEADLHDRIIKAYRAIRPFFDYMSEVLRVDANGEPRY